MKGCVKQRYKGSWYVIIDIGRDPDTGKRRQKWHSGFKTRKEAEAALAKLVNQINDGAYVEPTKVTLREFIEAEWLPAVRVSERRESTYRSYQANLRQHVLPTLGERKLQQITPAALTNLYMELLNGTAPTQPGAKRKRQLLSPRTVAYVHNIIRMALKYAVDQDKLIRNPADRATKPGTGKTEMNTWTRDQLRGFLDHVRSDRLYAAWRLLAMTGMRRGEVLGLRWGDLDLNAGRVFVRRSLNAGSGWQPEFGETKSGKGRSVPLDAETVAALRDHADRQADEMAALGPDYASDDLVFCREDGTPLRPRSFSRFFGHHVRDAALPRIRLHDVRHTFATLALLAGVHPKVVSEILGHSSIKITLDTYSHVIPEMQTDAAERVASLIA